MMMITIKRECQNKINQMKNKRKDGKKETLNYVKQHGKKRDKMISKKRKQKKQLDLLMNLNKNKETKPKQKNQQNKRKLETRELMK